MFIDYILRDKIHTFEQFSKEDLMSLNFLLTNSKGDFLNLGVNSNSCKYQGFSVCKTSTVEIFKFIESIVPTGVVVDRVSYFGDRVERTFKSSFTQEINYTYSDSETPDDFLSDTDEFFSKDKIATKDSFFVGPTGGLIYEIKVSAKGLRTLRKHGIV